PLSRPGDRAARAPCEGARPAVAGLRLPALHPSSREHGSAAAPLSGAGTARPFAARHDSTAAEWPCI
ncbi:MAG TPA: hypothetical protein VFA57_15050, partial [Pseudolabrys sp.]|nr:hypothetical protein [Pseudolabrys sp.]